MKSKVRGFDGTYLYIGDGDERRRFFSMKTRRKAGNVRSFGPKLEASKGRFLPSVGLIAAPFWKMPLNKCVGVRVTYLRAQNPEEQSRRAF
jgi:hypothetical protein